MNATVALPFHGMACPRLDPFHSTTLLGNCIQVFGTIKADLNQVATINATYSIDHQDPITSTTARFRSDQYQQLLWSSGMIDDGPHTLTVTIAVAQNGFYWLDYVAYTAPLQSASLVPSSFPPVQTEPPSTALIQDPFQGSSQLGYPTDTPTPNTRSSLNSSSIGGNHISTGGIVGVVISGVALLSIVASLLFWYHKRLAAQYTTISPLPTKCRVFAAHFVKISRDPFHFSLHRSHVAERIGVLGECTVMQTSCIAALNRLDAFIEPQSKTEPHGSSRRIWDPHPETRILGARLCSPYHTQVSTAPRSLCQRAGIDLGTPQSHKFASQHDRIEFDSC